MRHLDEGTIHAWLDGALDAEAEKKAEEHAARCTECAVAVADARGMIAAASRILTALDDVPAGVLPAGSTATPSRRTMAPGTRRWPVWTLRIAASIAVVATGTFVVIRGGARERMAEMDQKAAAHEELPPGVALKVTPAITPETTPSRNEVASAGAPAAPQPGAVTPEPQEKALADKDSLAYVQRADSDKGRSLDAARQLAVAAPKAAEVSSGSAAAGGAMAPANARTPAMAPASQAAAPAAPTDRLQAFATRPESTKSPSADLEAKKDANAPAEMAQAGKSKTEPAAAPTASRGSGIGAVSLPPGMRLVSQKQTKEDAGVVERRVYELRPGVQVVLAILEPAGGGAEDRASLSSDMRDSARRKLLANMIGSDEAAGLNSIQWTDSTGAEFTLSGPIPLDSLRAVRSRLPTKVQRQ